MAGLYKQGVQKIEVVVRRDGGAGGGDENGAPTEDKVEKEWTLRDRIFGTQSKKRQNRIIKTNATHFLAVSKQIAGLFFNYALSGVGDKTGDQAFQDHCQRQWELVGDATNVASSIAMGALYGSWGGPIGAVLGATMNGLSTAVSIGVKYANRQRDFSVKLFKEETAIEYQRARANINLTTGRLR